MKKIKGILMAVSAFCMLAIAKTSLAITSSTAEVEGTGLKVTDPSEVVKGLISKSLLILGGIATLMIVYGGFLLLFGGQNEDNIKKGRKIITYAIIGVIVIALAATIVRFALEIF